MLKVKKTIVPEFFTCVFFHSNEIIYFLLFPFFLYKNKCYFTVHFYNEGQGAAIITCLGKLIALDGLDSVYGNSNLVFIVHIHMNHQVTQCNEHHKFMSHERSN